MYGCPLTRNGPKNGFGKRGPTKKNAAWQTCPPTTLAKKGLALYAPGLVVGKKQLHGGATLRAGDIIRTKL
jgi:hypothetical protein